MEDEILKEYRRRKSRVEKTAEFHAKVYDWTEEEKEKFLEEATICNGCDEIVHYESLSYWGLCPACYQNFSQNVRNALFDQHFKI